MKDVLLSRANLLLLTATLGTWIKQGLATPIHPAELSLRLSSRLLTHRHRCPHAKGSAGQPISHVNTELITALASRGVPMLSRICAIRPVGTRLSRGRSAPRHPNVDEATIVIANCVDTSPECGNFGIGPISKGIFSSVDNCLRLNYPAWTAECLVYQPALACPKAVKPRS